MKLYNKYFLRLSTILMAAAIAFLVGCEGGDDPGDSNLDAYFANRPYLSDPRGNAENPVAISPESEFITVAGEQIAFRAGGGTGPYTWDVAVPANGNIDASANWRVGVYRSTTLSGNSVIVYDRNGYAAVATVSVSGEIDDLTATASPDALGTDGEKASLSATGGVPPYSWLVDDIALGNIDATSGNSVLYTRYNAGDNGVRVTDQRGENVTMVIRQP